jgi:hypothetical protein
MTKQDIINQLHQAIHNEFRRRDYPINPDDIIITEMPNGIPDTPLADGEIALHVDAEGMQDELVTDGKDIQDCAYWFVEDIAEAQWTAYYDTHVE